MNNKILVGVSACVVGEPVRFDGGHKNSRFVANDMADYFEYLPVCPEVGMGLPIPRPAIRLMLKDDDVRLCETKQVDRDHTDALLAYSREKVADLKTLPLCGYVVCAKSPSCGMEKVKVYQKDRAEKNGVGLYTAHLMKEMPWLPVEEDGRLHDPVLRENFITRVFALHDLETSMGGRPDAGKVVQFHSRYKLTLMAHHPEAYRELGQFVAKVKEYDSQDFFTLYRERFMQALSHRATKKNNTNVLMHLQGYFKRVLTPEQKAELARLIDEYRIGQLPLLVPLTLIKHYLTMHPDPYLEQQHFIDPYPQELGLRYGL